MRFTLTFVDVSVYIFETHLHDAMYFFLKCMCKSWCNNFMRVLHCSLSLDIMVCKKMKVLHFTLSIGGYGFLK